MKKTITQPVIKRMTKITLAIAAMWLMPKVGNAQKYYYNGSGTPDLITSWVDSVGVNPVSFSASIKATFIFGKASGSTTVHILKSFTIAANVIDSINLIIDSSAIFTISGAKLTVRPKTDTIHILSGGELVYDSKSAPTLTGKLHVYNGGTLALTRNIATIPAAIFDSTSNLVIGDGTDSITALPKMVSKGVYGNVTINTPAVTSSFGAKLLPNTASTYTVLGDLNIVAGRVTNSNPWPKKVVKTLSIVGNLNITGGTYIVCDSSSFNDQTKVQGDISVSAGALFATNNFIDTLIGKGSISVDGDLLHTGGLFGNASTSKVGGHINFSTPDTAGQVLSSTGFNNDVAAPLRLEVSGGNEVEVSSDIITNDTLILTLGYFTVTAGNTLILNKGSIGYSDTSYIITDAAVDSATMGKARFNNIPNNTLYTIPIGNDSTYQPISVQTADDSTSFTAYTYNGVTKNGTTLGGATQDVSNQVFSTWHIERNDAGKSPVTTVFNWDSTQEGSSFTGLADKDIAVYQNNGSGTLKAIATTGFNATDSAVVVLTTFGDFEIGNINVPLALKFVNVAAALKGQSINVSWKTTSEQNMTGYTVERSIDGIRFTAVGNVSANNKAANTYSLSDANYATGDNYYRIKAIDQLGKLTYSSVVKVSATATIAKSIGIYPNPVVGKVINIALNNQSANTYSIQLVSGNGQIVASKQINHAGGSSVNSFDVSNVSAKGIYFLKITSAEGQTSQTVLIK